MKNVYCAIDLGATSGRIILSADGKQLEEVHRFPNQIYEQNGMFFWNMDTLFEHILTGLKKVASRNDIHVLSIGVDTWGVDVVFLKEGKKLANPRAYRDPYTEKRMPEFWQTVSAQSVYQRTGIQMLPFNTLYQFYACYKDQYQPFLQADTYLFIPDYISYLLTGKMVCEYTILSTSQFLNPITKQIDKDLITAAGADSTCFPPIVYPGHKIGCVLKEVIPFAYDVPVIAVAGHDTASAVATVEQGPVAYLSSGTWSLMGIVVNEPVITEQSEAYNFTNEGGVEGTTRLLKNITGMWILEQCRKEWQAQGKNYSYSQLVEMAITVKNQADKLTAYLFNPDESRFANPSSMIHEIDPSSSLSDAQLVWLIYNSMAQRYAQVFQMLQSLAPWQIQKLIIIGGGAQNAYLNHLTEKAIGVPVQVGSVEATAQGNNKKKKHYLK